MSVLIAIDQGTTSTRAVAFDKDLNIIHSEQKEYPLIYPNDGWVVKTDKGDIECEHVVSCSGNFARQTGKMVGIDIDRKSVV